MRMPSTLAVVVVAFVAVLLPESDAAAKEAAVYLKDGTVYVGDIVDQTLDAVRIKTKVSNIVATITIKRSEIERIDDAKIPDSYLGDKPAAPLDPKDAGSLRTPAAPADPDPESTPYLLVPIKGVFGEEVFASAVTDAIRQAQQNNVKHIVFDVDTPGGLVSEALDLMKAVKEAKDTIHFTAYTRRALSAGVAVLVSCQDIFFEPGATVGAATAYTRDKSTGSTQVDAKMNSAFAGMLASTAESNGYSSAVIRAMVIQDASLWVWNGKDGRPVCSADPPPAGPNVKAQQLDNAQTVLTLTAVEAERIGFGRLIQGGGPAALGELLDAPGWKQTGDFGETAMRRAKLKQDEIDKIVRDSTFVADLVPSLIQGANAADPSRGTYYYDKTTARFTPESRRQWVQRTDDAIAAWDKLLERLRALRAMDSRYRALTREELFLKISIKEIETRAKEAQARLRRNREKDSV